MQFRFKVAGDLALDGRGDDEGVPEAVPDEALTAPEGSVQDAPVSEPVSVDSPVIEEDEPVEPIRMMPAPTEDAREPAVEMCKNPRALVHRLLSP